MVIKLVKATATFQVVSLSGSAVVRGAFFFEYCKV